MIRGCRKVLAERVSLCQAWLQIAARLPTTLVLASRGFGRSITCCWNVRLCRNLRHPGVVVNGSQNSEKEWFDSFGKPMLAERWRPLDDVHEGVHQPTRSSNDRWSISSRVQRGVANGSEMCQVKGSILGYPYQQNQHHINPIILSSCGL
jgi:hypothetical protein